MFESENSILLPAESVYKDVRIWFYSQISSLLLGIWKRKLMWAPLIGLLHLSNYFFLWSRKLICYLSFTKDVFIYSCAFTFYVYGCSYVCTTCMQMEARKSVSSPLDQQSQMAVAMCMLRTEPRISETPETALLSALFSPSLMSA